MAEFQNGLQHPTFGACERVPSLAAIRWKAPMSRDALSSALQAAGLLAAEGPAAAGTARGRTPQSASVNHSSLLTWVEGGSATELVEGTRDPNIEWVSPVYKAAASDAGERSYFAINPTVLFLTVAAAATVDVRAVDGTASIDQARTNVMKGFVVYRFPNGNVIDVAAELREKLTGLANAVSFENVPYLTPTTACGCGAGRVKSKAIVDRCAPAFAPYLPNDALFPKQWGLQRINAPQAWPISKGDPNVVIAVLDQGVELTHPDLNLFPVSYSTITHTNDGSPVGNHGTACAGIIASKMDNLAGATGLAPHCRVMAIATNFADTEVAEGLFYAADNGARVVSMSFGVYPAWMLWNFAIIEAALQYCYERNVVLVAATGNENQAVSRFPATDPRTLGIGGSNRDDVRKQVGDTSSEAFWGACYGPDCDVVAPCLEIPTTDRLGAAGYTPTDYDLFFNGTSSATPHVAALAGLVLSVDGSLSNLDVYRIISQTTDKINSPTYVYLPTAGKPYGSWNNDVGYGRINAERALLAACAERARHQAGGCTGLPEPEPCCVSPCDPPWLGDQSCIVWYEDKLFRVPLARDGAVRDQITVSSSYLEFKVTYEHQLCRLGKQHGPLLYTTTLLPGETVRLYHSDRYRRITSSQQRYSVQTTFTQFLSVVHEARTSSSLGALSERLTSSKSSSSGDVSAGFFAGLFGIGGDSASASSSSSATLGSISLQSASDTFNQSVVQSSLLTHAERSVVISSYEDRESLDVSVRTLQNPNECRAVTYFVRQVLELYALSTRVSAIAYRVVAPNVPPDFHDAQDVGWLPAAFQKEVQGVLQLLPKVGQVITQPKPVSLPTDGVVYDPELANCCSCEPERAATIQHRLQKEEAEARIAQLGVKELELELERRRLLLAKGELGPFEAPSSAP